jgi:hypothetical protein
MIPRKYNNSGCGIVQPVHDHVVDSFQVEYGRDPRSWGSKLTMMSSESKLLITCKMRTLTG